MCIPGRRYFPDSRLGWGIGGQSVYLFFSRDNPIYLVLSLLPP